MQPIYEFDSGEITAAVLAGGAGRRVDGRDKGLLPLAGKPLVAHVCEALRGQAGAILICANRHAADYADFGRVVRDTTDGFRGPLAGIAAALTQCTGRWLFTVPVDGPDLPGNLAERLFKAAQTGQVDAAVVHDGTRRQPLFALYRSRLAASCAAALAQDLAVWRWQDQHAAIEVDCSDAPNAFVNLNTLDDLRDWEARHDF